MLISEEQSLGRVSQYLLGIAYKVLWLSLRICLSVHGPVLGMERGHEGHFFSPLQAQGAIDPPGLGQWRKDFTAPPFLSHSCHAVVLFSIQT